MKDERFKELLIDDEQLFRHIRLEVESKEVRRMLKEGDKEGLAAYANRGNRERAKQAVARIRQVESLPDTGTQAAEGLLVEALSEILERFPSPDVIEEIRADAGYGFRKYQINATDKDIVKWRQALSTYKQGKTPKE